MREDSDDVEGIGAGRPIYDHRRSLRKLLLTKKESTRRMMDADQDRLLSGLSCDLTSRKKGFSAAALRGFGCAMTSKAHVFAPTTIHSDAAAEAVRASADWEGRKSRSRRKKMSKVNKESEREKEMEGFQPFPVRRNQPGDLWCAPGIGFSSGDASVDCVLPSFQQNRRSLSRGSTMAVAGSERIEREHDLYNARRGESQERKLPSLLDSPQSPFNVPIFGSDFNNLIPPRQLQRTRRIRRSPGGLDEIMMFQATLMFGEMNMHDRYNNWRLDVDDMSYEELLELGDKIGYVSTGLKEEDIFSCLSKIKEHSFNASSSIQLSTELEKKCSICQEDYEVNDEVGKLDCGHNYHIHCIKQWLLRKNACPVCKATVSKSRN